MGATRPQTGGERSATSDPAMLDRGAAVHDDCQAGFGRDARGRPAHDAQLEPQASSADRDRLPSMRLA